MASPPHQEGEDGLRERLQLLLDDKEKQLQLAGTLGQRILAQQMELEDRINQLPLSSSSLLNPEDTQQQEDIRDKLKELQGVLATWEDENASFFSKLAAQASNAKLDPSETIDVFQAPGAPSGSLPVDSRQPSAIQSSRRAKNAAHRADDVEFAFEIGSGLLTEVRRLQSLLGERDKAIQDMKEEKDDLERSNASLRSSLLAQEQNTDRFKEENWNLEVTLQELRTQAGDLQSSNARLEGEQKRLTKQLTQSREAADKLKAENETLASSLADLKAKHETDIAQMRKNAASLQRDKSDLQAALESVKADAEKRTRAIRALGSENGGPTKPFLDTGTGAQAEDESIPDAFALSLNPPSPGLRPIASDDPFDLSELSPSPTKDVSKTGQEEMEVIKRNYLHAQRQIASLKSSLMKEKELRLEQRRKVSSPPTVSTKQYRYDDDDDDDYDDGEDGGGCEGEGIQESSTKGRRRSRPRKQVRSQKSLAKDSGLRRIGVAPTAKVVESSQGAFSVNATDAHEQSVAQDVEQELDPAFIQADQSDRFARPSSTIGDTLSSAGPSHLALELGMPKAEKPESDILPPTRDSAYDGRAEGSQPANKILAPEHREASIQVHREPVRVHISVATEPLVVEDVACQTDRELSFGLPSPDYIDAVQKNKATLQVTDRGCQTDAIDDILRPSQAGTSSLSKPSLPFRFIPPNMKHRSEFGGTTREVGPSVQLNIKPNTTSEETVEDDILSETKSTNGSQSVDRSIPPTINLPPPPAAPPPPTTSTSAKSPTVSHNMPPPMRIPEKRVQVPARPLSPPPRELIQRATTPLSARAAPKSGRPDMIGISEGGDRRSEKSFKVHDSFPHHARHHSSSASVASDFHSSNPSRRSSLSSNHFNIRRDVAMTGGPLPGLHGMQAAGDASTGSTDPNIIHAITQTMIGEFLYKYTRRTIGKGYGDKRHKRYFWVHPYTKTIYWSSSDPSAVGGAESNAKSAFIESVRSVLDPNPLPPGIYQYSVVVSTPQREMKFTAPSKERHDIWIAALNFLLSRPASLPHSPEVRRAERQGTNSSYAARGSITRPEAGLLSSPQSGRTLGSSYGSDTWNITPRAHPGPSTPLSQLGSVRRRPGTPAAEYMRWGSDVPNSPDHDFEQIAVQPGESDFDFEIHDDVRNGVDFDGLENVRTCCDGAHTIGKHHRDDHLHHVEHEEARHSHVRPVSPSGWSFRSRAGSSRANDGGGSLFARQRNR